MVAEAVLENNVNPEEETFGKDFVCMDLGGEKKMPTLKLYPEISKNIPMITMNCHSGLEESMRKEVLSLRTSKIFMKSLSLRMSIRLRPTNRFF